MRRPLVQASQRFKAIFAIYHAWLSLKMVSWAFIMAKDAWRPSQTQPRGLGKRRHRRLEIG